MTATWTSDSEILPLLGYIIGIPGVIIALIICFVAEKELIDDDIKPRNKLFAIAFHLLVLLGSFFLAYSIYIEYPNAYSGNTVITEDSQKFMIYTFICIAIKSIISIIANALTIHHYYSLFSPDYNLLNTDEIYDAIIKNRAM